MTKKYTLELTAEEAASMMQPGQPGVPSSVFYKLEALAKQAKADREADELRLPWRVDSLADRHGIAFEAPEYGSLCRLLHPNISLRAAKLMSAAPELIEAVEACKEQIERDPGFRAPVVVQLIERALRKVETGTPETP